MTENDVSGLSIVVHKGNNYKLFYLGKYIKGVFSDNNKLLDKKEDEQSGWGFKIDLFFANVIRPIPRFWKIGFWTGKTKISDIPYKEWDEYFGKEMAKKLRLKCKNKAKNVKIFHDGHFSTFNPWKGINWFILRLPKCIPLGFLSVSTPWRSFYIGFKSSRIDPFLPKKYTIYNDGNDITFTNESDEEKARLRKPYGEIRVGVLSATTRSHRA